MRKFFIGILIAIASFFAASSYTTWASCDLSSGSAMNFLQWCAEDSPGGVDPSILGNGTTGIKELVQKVAKRVIEFGALFAIGAIVFSGIRYTTSYGDDEKIKHAKTTGIYALIGLLLLGLAFPLVDIIVNFIYTFGN